MSNNIAVTDIDTLAVGRVTLNLLNDTVLTGIKDFTADPESDEEQVFHQGAGDNPLLWQARERWSVTVTIEGGNIATLAALTDITLGAAGQFGVPHGLPGTPIGWLERRIYDEEMDTLLFSQVVPDVIPRNLPIVGPMERAEIDVSMMSFYRPYTFKDLDDPTTQEIVAFEDTFTATGVELEYALTHTPLTIDTTGLNNALALYVKMDGVRQTEDYTINAGTKKLTFGSNPVVDTVIKMLYAYDLNEV